MLKLKSFVPVSFSDKSDFKIYAGRIQSFISPACVQYAMRWKEIIAEHINWISSTSVTIMEQCEFNFENNFEFRWSL